MPTLRRKDPVAIRAERRERTRQAAARVAALTAANPALGERLAKVTGFSRRVRVSEYHLTNACNIRCKGCWFFEYEHEKETREVTDEQQLEQFILRETQERKINCALIIGGEPTLFPERLRLFMQHMRYVSISSNGLKRLPREGFENAMVGLTLFGGGSLDDDLRAIKPNGKRFTGLFDTALEHYRDDDRATFIYALSEDGIEHIEPTVRRIRDNGNIANFNFYSKYGDDSPSALRLREDLLAEALRVKALYPQTVVSHPYYIRTMVTGTSHWGQFGYETCPSISVDHPAHAARIANGNPYLPVFNTWAADMKTVKFCCTSGHCNGCRDSQAVLSWLLMSMEHFLADEQMLTTWIEIAEGYWSQFRWTPFHRASRGEEQAARQPAAGAEALATA